MRSLPRLVIGTALLAGAVTTAAPAAAQEAVCGYPFDCEIGGESGGAGTGDVGSGGSGTGDLGNGGGGGTGDLGSGAGGGSDSVSNPTVLPFTGGELTVLLLAGGATLAGGAALVVAARKRATA